MWRIEHGTSNAARDGNGALVCGNRIDFGCGGQNWVHNDLPGGNTQWKPCTLCGTDVFQKLGSETNQTMVRLCVGKIFDAIQNIEDLIHNQLEEDATYPNQERFQDYGRHLQEFLFAKSMKNEWVTIQVKCLSRKDKTLCHKDSSNCTWRGYDKTGCLCFVLQDNFQDVWSIKFIANSHIRSWHIMRNL